MKIYNQVIILQQNIKLVYVNNTYVINVNLLKQVINILILPETNFLLLRIFLLWIKRVLENVLSIVV